MEQAGPLRDNGRRSGVRGLNPSTLFSAASRGPRRGTKSWPAHTAAGRKSRRQSQDAHDGTPRQGQQSEVRGDRLDGHVSFPHHLLSSQRLLLVLLPTLLRNLSDAVVTHIQKIYCFSTATAILLPLTTAASFFCPSFQRKKTVPVLLLHSTHFS